ncbi:MAG TPA: hypothetical protein VMF57_12935 [Solirubrobacteraceae bacterium]|nr:hypothetical protein [Solirubrobacteraceae bacterium]
MVGKAQTGGFDIVGVVYLVIVFGVMFLPMLLCRSQAPPSTDSDQDDGWGPGTPGPPDLPVPPSGGLLLPDAEQSAMRLRDHGRLRERRRRRRRPAHEPVRTPPPPVKTH